MQASCMSDAPASRLSRKKRLRVCPRSPEGGGTVGNSQFEVKGGAALWPALQSGRWQGDPCKGVPDKKAATRQGRKQVSPWPCLRSKLPAASAACLPAGLPADRVSRLMTHSPFLTA